MKPVPWSTSLRQRRKTFPEEHVQCIALQGQLQQHDVVLEEIESVPCHSGPAFEVDQVELLRQLDVIQRFEIELRNRGLSAEKLQVRFVVDADRGRGVREIGNRAYDRLRIGGDLIELLLDLRSLVADAAAFFLQRLALFRRRLAD
jgi:hypothetical protein